MVHSEKDYEAAVEASQILFSNNAGEALKALDEQTLFDIFDGVPRFAISRAEARRESPCLTSLLSRHRCSRQKGKPARWCKVAA